MGAYQSIGGRLFGAIVEPTKLHFEALFFGAEDVGRFY